MTVWCKQAFDSLLVLQKGFTKVLKSWQNILRIVAEISISSIFEPIPKTKAIRVFFSFS